MVASLPWCPSLNADVPVDDDGWGGGASEKLELVSQSGVTGGGPAAGFTRDGLMVSGGATVRRKAPSLAGSPPLALLPSGAPLLLLLMVLLLREGALLSLETSSTDGVPIGLGTPAEEAPPPPAALVADAAPTLGSALGRSYVLSPVRALNQ